MTPMRRLLPLALMLVLVWTGCGAYFNTYYNAEKAYDKAERLLAEGREKDARTQFDECLKVSSKLLQFYPNSRWVDNTILMVGRCYVQMDQQRHALRKFDELASSYPDSPLLPSARIWRARAELRLENPAGCLAELSRLDMERLDRKERVEALRVQSELYRFEKDRPRLVESLERLLETARRNADRAAIHLDMAVVQEQAGHWEEALRHYNAVRRYRPARALLLRSWLGSLDNNLRLDRLDVVERRLDKLAKDERFYDARHALQVRRGWLLEQRGDLAAARAEWNLVRGETGADREAVAAANHSLGRAFLFHEGQLDSARAYLKAAGAAKGDSPWADSSARDLALVDALDKARKEIKRLDDLFRQAQVGLDPDSARLGLARSLLPRVKARRDSARTDSLRQLQAATRDSTRTDTLLAASQAAVRMAARPDSLPPKESLAKRGGNRVKLFDFQKKEREAARADSLRQAQVADSLEQARQRQLTRWEDSLLVAGILDTLTRKPSIDSLRLLSTADSLAGLRFEQVFYLAEVELGRMGRPQRADSLLRSLADTRGLKDEQMARLLYARAILKLDHTADSSGRGDLASLVERWPLAPAANPARLRLGLPLALGQEDSAAIRLREVEARPPDDPLDRLAALRAVADRYPGTAGAASALLAAGALGLDELENPVLAAGIYRRFLREHPAHPEADRVRRRLGQAVANLKEEVPTESVAVPAMEIQTAQLDAEGGFVDPDSGKPLLERLQTLRMRLEEVGRFQLEQILE